MRSARWSLLAALAVAAACPGHARAEECAASVDDWVVQKGALAPGIACGTYFLTTDGWGGPFSSGEVSLKKTVSLPFSVEVTWRRLGSDEGESLVLLLPGAYLLFRRGEYGLYSFSESAFEWIPLPGFHAHEESTVKVEQDAKGVVVWVGGARVGSIPFVAPVASGGVGVGFKGVSGYRSRMTFRGFSVHQGHAPATSAPRPK